MFWKFNLMTSHIDTLLDKEDLTLHEILDEDDVLQECRAQNKRLVEFLTRSDNVEELINLVTQEPSDDTEEKVRYKYPNTACELLTSDVSQITDKVAGDEALINKVYSFLEAEGPLNPLLASFFSKVLGLLITRKSEMMLEFLQSKEDFIGQLLRHLGTSAIMDLFLRLVTCIENHECQMQCLKWLNEKELIKRLVSMIDPEHSDEKHCNASQSLCDIIRLSREQMSQLQDRADPDPLLASIESEEVITDLLNHMFDKERSSSVLINGISVIQTLLEFKRIGPDGRPETITQLDSQRLAHGVHNTIQALVPRLKDFHQILKEPPKQHYLPMNTTVGSLNPPFGNTRLQTTKLITTLLITNTTEVNKELVNLGTLGVLLDLSFQYVWNNFLHTQVEQCVATVLSVAEEENQNPSLLDQLMKDFNVLERFLKVWEENEQQKTQPSGHRMGYMGHLTKMANHVVSNSEKGNNSEKIKEHIQALPDDLRSRWETFVSTSLSEVNKQNTVEMAGGQHLYSSSEDDDPDFRDIPFPQDTAMQQAFSEYQLQQMTSNFIDQFGLNEPDFADADERASEKFKDRISSINFEINTDEITNASAMFEQACSEHVQQFDDQENDEDLWEEKEITFSQSSDSRQNSASGAISGPAPPTATPEDSNSSDSEEEELDSPRRIHQSPASSGPQQIIADSTTPATAAEKMDVDTGDNWANFDDICMETTSGETPSSTSWPSGAPPGSELDSGNNWANFDSATSQVPSTTDDWESGNLSTTDPGPRSSSPVAMETSDDTSGGARPNAYLVSSAPADLASEVSQVNVDSKESSSSSDAPSSTSSDPSPSTTVAPADTSSDAAVKSPSRPSGQADTSTTDSPKDSLSSEASSTPKEPAAGNHDDTVHHGDTMEEDLSDNFDFLASSGLMKCSDGGSQSSSETSQGESSGDSTADSSSSNKLEQIRAQAKDALDQFTTATASPSDSATSPPPAQNGPV